MSAGPIITGGVVVLALGGGIWAMLCGATPYVTVAQAKASHGDRLNLVGNIEKGTVHTDRAQSVMNFKLCDPDGAEILVHYNGEPVANMPAAERIVALGTLRNNEFYTDKLLIKCPSKYEEKRQTGAVATR